MNAIPKPPMLTKNQKRGIGIFFGGMFFICFNIAFSIAMYKVLHYWVGMPDEGVVVLTVLSTFGMLLTTSFSAAAFCGAKFDD